MNLSVWQIEDRSRKHQARFAFLATIGSMFFGAIVGVAIVLSFADPASTNLNLPRWAIVLSEALILPPLVLIILRRRLPLNATFRWQSVPFRTLRDALLIGLGITVLIDELYSLLELVFPLPDSIAQGMKGISPKAGDLGYHEGLKRQRINGRGPEPNIYYAAIQIAPNDTEDQQQPPVRVDPPEVGSRDPGQAPSKHLIRRPRSLTEEEI